MEKILQNYTRKVKLSGLQPSPWKRLDDDESLRFEASAFRHFGLVAQLIEHLAGSENVAGLSPVRSTNMKTYSQQLQDWIDNEKKNGLVDFKFTLNPFADKKTMTVESVAKELLEMIHAPTVPDPELF